MSGFATIIAPMSFSSAIELGNRLWSKKVLPVGDIEYQGRMLDFTPAYIQGLAAAFKDKAYDQVSFQLADSQNAHTNDPERHRGTIVDMKAQADGLYITLQPTERGEQILRENPFLGVSARIVEQYQRSDGTFFPAAIQHILGTLDPRIPNLGSWRPVDMANSGAITIDLSSYHFAGEPAPAYADDELSDRELDDLIDVISEVEDSYGGTETYDDPAYTAAMEQFDAAFSAAQAATQAREDARAAALVQDLMSPAHRDEDRMQRLISRAADGVYDGQQLSFASEQSAVELTMANGGAGPCGPPDEFGRCSARYHESGCSHDVGVDWAFSNPPASTGAASLANLADRLDLNLSRRSVWSDPDDPDEPGYEMPAATIELARDLAVDWGLDSTPGGPDAAAYADLMRPPAAPVSVQDALLQDMGYELEPQLQPQRPGIRELAEQLGLRR